MKLTLNKAWFEKKIQANENYEVGIGVPESIAECTSSAHGDARPQLIQQPAPIPGDRLTTQGGWSSQ